MHSNLVPLIHNSMWLLPLMVSLFISRRVLGSYRVRHVLNVKKMLIWWVKLRSTSYRYYSSRRYLYGKRFFIIPFLGFLVFSDWISSLGT